MKDIGIIVTKIRETTAVLMFMQLAWHGKMAYNNKWFRYKCCIYYHPLSSIYYNTWWHCYHYITLLFFHVASALPILYPQFYVFGHSVLHCSTQGAGHKAVIIVTIENAFLFLLLGSYKYSNKNKESLKTWFQRFTIHNSLLNHIRKVTWIRLQGDTFLL